MKVVWICGLPDQVRRCGWREELSSISTPAWSWILGHLPPPDKVDLHICCPVVGLKQKQIHFYYLGVHWHCFRRHPFKHVFSAIPYFFRVRRFFTELNPDIVHGWGGETGFGYVATFLSRQSIVSVQGLLLLYCGLSSKFKDKMRSFHGRWMLWREKQSYNRARVLLVESDASHIALKKYYGQEAIMIPHPLRPEFLQPELDGRKILADKQIIFVFVGGLVDRKGAMDALVAFGKIATRNARLVFIGEGERKEAIEQYVAVHSLSESVSIKGSLASREIVREFRAAQFFLLPSYGDTGPTALKEALSCGLYPICYNNSGPADLIARYGCGKLVETGNIDALIDVMSHCASDVKTCIAQGCVAARRVRAELSKEHVWSQLVKIYDEVGK